MYVKPAVDRARFRENLAAAMQAKGHNPKSLSEVAGLDMAQVDDARLGLAGEDVLAALAKALGHDLRALAPLTDLRDPDRHDRLPLEGRDVPATDWWKRRLSDGGVELAEPPSEPSAVPPDEPLDLSETADGKSKKRG